jgi:predicted nucleotidyltransferase
MYPGTGSLPIGNTRCQIEVALGKDRPPDMTTAMADQVVADTVEAAQDLFGNEIAAIFTLGSLAHGGFAPLVSDVDVAIVLDSTNPGTAERIALLQRIVTDRASSPLSDRLSLFWGDWHAVRTGEGDRFRLGPVDRLDLLESGRLVLGSDLREPSVRPSTEDLVLMSADLMLSKFTADYLDDLRDSQALVAGGPRVATKAVLFPVRFMYTLRTGRIGLNEDSANWYGSESLPGGALALKAIDWRNKGIADPELAIQMLDAELATLHAECLTEYAKELDSLGEIDRAAALAGRADCAEVAVPDRR